MSGSSSKSSQSSRSDNTSVSIGIGGDNHGYIVDGNGNTFNQTDHGAIEGAMGLIESTLQSQADVLLATTDSNNQLSEIAINSVSDAMIDSNNLAESAMLTVADSQESVTQLAGEFGNNLTAITDLTISGNQALSETAMNNNALLVSQFGSDMLSASETAMNNNAMLTQQFGADMAIMADKNAAMARASMDNNAALASQFGSDLNQTYNNFGDSLTDLTSQTQQALTEMAVLQERGLDNALSVAGSMSMDDSAESSAEMVKYISLGLAAIGAAMVFRR